MVASPQGRRGRRAEIPGGAEGDSRIVPGLLADVAQGRDGFRQGEPLAEMAGN